MKKLLITTFAPLEEDAKFLHAIGMPTHLLTEPIIKRDDPRVAGSSETSVIENSLHKGAYLAGKAFDKFQMGNVIAIEGEVGIFDLPIEEQDIELIAPDTEYKCFAVFNEEKHMYAVDFKD